MQSEIIIPPYLKPGDTVGILCTARSAMPDQVQFAVKTFESWGLKVKIGDTIGKEWNIFGGSDDERAQNFNEFLIDTEIKAIICARGGYGTVRMIDQIDFSLLEKQPKWIVGFSDITSLHCHINSQLHMATIHASMPVVLENKTLGAINSLRQALFGEKIIYPELIPHSLNRPGKLEGAVVGGNLSLIYAMQGTPSELNTDGRILFLEEVEEWLYSTDRMMWNLKRSGKLKNLKGLLIGGFTKLLDNEIPFGMSHEEIIMEKVAEYSYPVYFNFPAGHIEDNLAIVFGVPL